MSEKYGESEEHALRFDRRSNHQHEKRERLIGMRGIAPALRCPVPGAAQEYKPATET